MSDDDKALDLAELRRVAEAATPGPWQFEPEGDYECGEPGCCTEYWDNRIWGGGVVIAESHLTSADDSQHIATFDPPTVLALLDRLQKAEGDWFDVCAELRESQTAYRLMFDQFVAQQKRAEAAEAKVARVERLADCPHGARHYYAVDATCQRCEMPSWVEAALRDALRGDA